MAPSDFVVAGSYFLLREVEPAAAKVEHVKLSADQLSVDWLLPTSKTDPRAVGVTRSWDCCCPVESLRPACPVCAIVRQLDRARLASARLGAETASFPLFFTSDGKEVGKVAAVATITRLAELTGEVVTSPTVGHLFGGHSLRTGGAALLAGRGVHPLQIQSLGR